MQMEKYEGGRQNGDNIIKRRICFMLFRPSVDKYRTNDRKTCLPVAFVVSIDLFLTEWSCYDFGNNTMPSVYLNYGELCIVSDEETVKNKWILFWKQKKKK